MQPPRHYFRYDYPSVGDTTLIIKWHAVTHRTTFSHDSIDVVVQATVFKGESDVSFGISVENEDSLSLFDVDFPYYRIREFDADTTDQILALPWSGHGNLVPDPISKFDVNEGSQKLNQDFGENRAMGFGTTWHPNDGQHPGPIAV